jgi:hypothetical protein
VRSNDDQKLIFALAERLALEELAQDRDVADTRDLGEQLGHSVVN